MKNARLTTASIAAIFASLAAAWFFILGTVGNAEARDQSTAGEYIDDSAITARVKARFAKDKDVSATAISVETLRGEVQLSGFVKTADEKARAEAIARDTPGVKSVRNGIAIRP